MLQSWRVTPIEMRLFLTVWLIYLFHLAPLTGANENRYLDLVFSIVDEGRLSIDTYHYNTVDKSYYNGRYYAGAAPGPSFLAIPIYVLLRLTESFLPVTLFGQYDTHRYIREYLKGGSAPDSFISAYPFGKFLVSHLFLTALTCSLFTALAAVFVFRCAKQLNSDTRAALWVACIFAFGTINFFYAVRLYAHTLSMFFLFCSFLLLRPFHADRIPGKRHVLWSGMAAGTAVFMDYTAGPIAVMLTVYGAWVSKGRTRLYPLAGFGVPVVMLLWYHYQCFGHPLTTPYDLPNDPTNPGSHAEYREGFHGFSFPGLIRLWDMTFGLYRGIFAYMPVLAVSLYGFFRYLTRRSGTLTWTLVLGACVVQILFTAMMRYWYGGWDFGPRYIIPMLPFAVLGLVPVFATRWRILVTALAVVSVFINWTGAQYGPANDPLGCFFLFCLSGPTSPLYQFLSTYFSTYTTWDIVISPYGGWLILGGVIAAIWRWRRHSTSERQECAV